MKVLFLPFYEPEGPSSRLRVYQYLEPLRARGIQAEAVRPPAGQGIIRRLRYFTSVLARAPGADVVVIQKQTLAWGIDLLAAANHRLVYDFDDAVYARPVWEGPAEPGRSRRVARTMRRCRAVIAGNRYLAEYARGHCPDVTVIPTGVDIRALPANESPPPDSKVTIGWTGTRENLWYLDRIKEVFPRLHREFGSRIAFQIISNGTLVSGAVPIEHVTWTLEGECRNLSRFDVGLAPLGDDPWSRGKCGFKAIQYMALGIPPVASRAGVYPEIITDGENGFLAGDIGEWEEKISRLAREPGTRGRIGKAAREEVARAFSLEKNLPRLVDVIARVAAGG